ncbi:MAG: hypothetical protein AVDCRST_MAG19-4502, partial [uncultured Thermomicrobiales bacterium]
GRPASRDTHRPQGGRCVRARGLGVRVGVPLGQRRANPRGQAPQFRLRLDLADAQRVRARLDPGRDGVGV